MLKNVLLFSPVALQSFRIVCLSLPQKSGMNDAEQSAFGEKAMLAKSKKDCFTE